MISLYLLNKLNLGITVEYIKRNNAMIVWNKKKDENGKIIINELKVYSHGEKEREIYSKYIVGNNEEFDQIAHDIFRRVEYYDRFSYSRGSCMPDYWQKKTDNSVIAELMCLLIEELPNNEKDVKKVLYEYGKIDIMEIARIMLYSKQIFDYDILTFEEFIERCYEDYDGKELISTKN